MYKPKPPSRFHPTLLWTLAILLMAAAVFYQKRTGPTYPLRTAFVVAGVKAKAQLIRSEETTKPARVAVPDLGQPATLVWRHFPTQEAWTRVPMSREVVKGRAELAAYLPIQPPAGKVEYVVEVGEGDRVQRLPAKAAVVLRYKGPVKLKVLLPHIAMMFIAVLLGLRTGLEALGGPRAPRKLIWATLGCMTLGGLVLGPLVQKAAFGAYWTGFPFGYDLTDNKTVLMWLAWVLAALVAGSREKRSEGLSRVAVVLATIAMTVVYLIPHSLRGSQLDYSKVKAGGNAHEAIVTGR